MEVPPASAGGTRRGPTLAYYPAALRKLDALNWRLAQAFETTPTFWLNLQVNYDLARNRPRVKVSSLLGKAS